MNSSWHIKGSLNVSSIGSIQQYNIGENPPLYSTLTLIVMQGHQQREAKLIMTLDA